MAPKLLYLYLHLGKNRKAMWTPVLLRTLWKVLGLLAGFVAGPCNFGPDLAVLEIYTGEVASYIQPDSLPF
jgi:hypothetical protein